jgi:two-component system CheB/CheR fusion protein
MTRTSTTALASRRGSPAPASPVIEPARPAASFLERVPAAPPPSIPDRLNGLDGADGLDGANGTMIMHPAERAFPIVGIGASAGGLEALDQFLRNVRGDSDAAFIVVQHHDPAHGHMLADVLRTMTHLDVVEGTNGTRVESRRVYVIPPGKNMSLLHGTLQLLPQASDATRVLPIDFFFRSLAHDQGERSIGVILSGMGTDGTLGLRAIKEAGGAAFVQTPSTAKFDSMPRSAIDTGLADVVLPVDELPARILSYRDHASAAQAGADTRPPTAQTTVEKVCLLLRDYSGNDFTLYKRSTIYRRIERRMALHQIHDHDQYLRFLREHPQELEILFNELLIGVTSFFRDPGEWERLRHDILPGLFTLRAPGGVLRVWAPGCSTGEEAYSLAMVFHEVLDPIKTLRKVSVQIFATDLDRSAIEKARLGVYPENIAADVSPERLRRFFVRDDRGYRVNKDIRETVVFAPQNVLTDPPFTKVDVVSCRNLLIYLSGEVQKRLIPLFHYCLNPGGALFLGTAETIGGFTNLFAPLDGRTRLYRRLDQSSVLPLDVQFASFGRHRASTDEHSLPPPPIKQGSPNLQGVVDRLLVQRFGPLGILCDPNGDVLYVSGRAGKYLEPAVGKATVNIFAMAREGLRYELTRAFARALRASDRPVIVPGLRIGSNGGIHVATLTVQKLVEPRELAGTVIVVLRERETAPAVAPRRPVARSAGARAHELEDELHRTREQVQTIREEMQTSQEELKSTNEELQSTNEELQSTNEELTTSKEEMQSLNEELQTVNHELQSKVDQLSRSNNDMKNLLNSTDIATLFLDANLRVRRFTTATAQIIKLIPADTGRPVTDIASDLDYPQLAADAREVLRTLVFQEKQAVAHDGRAFSVRIMPYRTLDNVIDGVVITFTDITAVRTLEVAAREQAEQLRQMSESLPHLVFGARPDGAFDFVSRQWVEYTGVPDVDQQQWGWLEQLHSADRDRVRDEWRAALRTGTNLDTELRIRGANGSYRWFKTRGAPIREASGTIVQWYGSCTDIDELKRTEDRLAVVLASIRDGFIGVDKDLVVVAINPQAERMLGCRAEGVVGRVLLDGVPALRDIANVANHHRHAQAEFEFPLDVIGGVVRVQRNQEGGYLVFLRPQEVLS